jgi:hypothetical protein
MENSEEIKTPEDKIEGGGAGANMKKKVDFRFELALFLILGFLLGVVIKSEAVKRVTIGFDDGAIPSVRQAYDFEKIEQDIAAASEKAQSQASPASGEDSNQSDQSNQSNQ